MVALAEPIRVKVDPGCKPFKHYGAVERLFYCRDSEICIHGPAGTGKSRGALEKLHLCALKYAGMRGLLVRKTRASLSQSTLVTYENEVLPENSSIKSGAHRTHRMVYRYPNKSEIVVGGLDNPDRIMSSQYDMIVPDEYTECEIDDHEKLMTRLRHGIMPYQQIIGMCNPSSQIHWLRQRMDDGGMVDLKSEYQDNPRWWNHIGNDWTEEGRNYIAKLDKLTGVRKDRLRWGLWVAAEGQIWPNFRPNKHIIDKWDDPADPIGWHFASVDWGFDRPGVILVWAVTKKRRAILVHEVYMSEKTMDWWTEKAVRLQNQYEIRSFVCDPSRPDNIELFNHRLYQVGDRNCAIAANNKFEAGANMVRDRLDDAPSDGKPMVLFMRDSLEKVDERMEAEKSAKRLTDEIPDYTWREIKPGQSSKEEPAHGLDDHACDAFRYGMNYLDFAMYEPKQPVAQPKPGTANDRFRFDEQLKKIRAKMQANRSNH